MHISRKFTRWALPVAAVAALVVQTAIPASAQGAGAMTGWEGPVPIDEDGCGEIPTGFDYSSATFYLRDSVATPVVNVEIEIDDFVAAPQGARPGACGDATTPIVPGAVTITSAKVGATTCNLTPSGIPDGLTNVPDTYLRVNTTVVMTFNCGPAVWVLTGNQNICSPIPNPECDSPDAAGYPDPVDGGAGSHFILAYAHT